MAAKKNTNKLDQKPQILIAEVFPAEKATPATLYSTAVAKADAVISSAGGGCRGLIPT